MFFLISMGSFLGTASAARHDDARSAIEAQWRTFSDALAQGDPVAAARIFATDAKLSVPGVDAVLAGRQPIANFWQSAFASGLKGLELATTDLEGDGSMRIETGVYTALGADRRELGRGYYLVVWKKEEGAWKIYRDFGHPDAAPGAGARAVDRVGFPHDYRQQFRNLGGTLDDPNFGLTTVFANELAASSAGSEGTQYPDGSVILMEFANPQRDGEDQLLRDAHGQPLKGEVAHIDVMRRGAGFGSAYGADRAGEWEFASYRPDGSTLIPPDKAQHCAACHIKAGAAKDYVYRLRSWAADH